MKRSRAGLIALALTAGAGSAARAQAPEVQVGAVPEFTAVRGGAAFRVAVRLQVPPGWHIGWINPGAGGLPTTITWHVPPGASFRETEFPYPETDDAAGEISHVYRNTVVLFTSFGTAPEASGTLRLAADLDWGLCREQCVRQERTVTVSVAVTRAASRRAEAWSDVALAQRSLPVRVPASQVRVRVDGDSATAMLAGLPNGPAAGSWLTFFPLQAGKRSVVARLRAVGGDIAITLPVAALSGDSASRLAGVLVGAHPPGAPPATRALAVDAPVSR